MHTKASTPPARTPDCVPLMKRARQTDDSAMRAALIALRARPLTFLFALAVLCFPAQRIIGQASPTAVRSGDLQVGGGFTIANGDYDHPTYRGFNIYSSFDFKPHWGVEVDFHQLNTPSPYTYYERTYEVGGRYVRHYGIVNPYARLMVGRGVFNYQFNIANLAYNMAAGGVGADVNVSRRVNVRADFEYQQWYGFKGVVSGTSITNATGTLSPSLFTIGAAYHFQ